MTVHIVKQFPWLECHSRFWAQTALQSSDSSPAAGALITEIRKSNVFGKCCRLFRKRYELSYTYYVSFIVSYRCPIEPCYIQWHLVTLKCGTRWAHFGLISPRTLETFEPKQTNSARYTMCERRIHWLKWSCEAGGGSPDEARLEQTPYPFQPQ